MEMNFSNYYTKLFKRIYISKSVASLPLVERVKEIVPSIPCFEITVKEDIPKEHLNSESLYLSRQTGRMIDRCPGTKGHLCCNYLTINLYSGCTVGCSYCIMQWYLNFEPITVFADPGPAVREIRRIAAENPETIIRVGTGEIGDSLQFDPLCGLSRPFIEGLGTCENVFFEMKTKTDFVDHLLEIERKGNAVMAFSLNPQRIADAEEPDAVSIERRLAAAERASSAGYRLAFHFDPIIYGPAWEEEYGELVDSLRPFAERKIAWISLGTVRYPPELKEKMQDRPYLYDEFVRCRDGKFRYIQVKRVGMYRTMVSALRNAGIEAPVYLCMESGAVWEAVFGSKPQDIPLLEPIFDRCAIHE